MSPPRGQPLHATHPDPFADLNAQQRAVLAHDADAGPLLIVAGAGTGKTTTLAARVARLVQDGTAPQRILLLTFSRRAAAEMSRRVAARLQALRSSAHRPAGSAAALLPWCGTFHSVAARLLRELAPALDLSPRFSVLDRGDAEDLLALARTRLGYARVHGRRFPLAATCQAIFSRCIDTQAALADVLRDAYPWCAEWHGELQTLEAAYAAEKRRQHSLDYDDLLRHWWSAMQRPALADELRARFDQVLVDEYQDTNRLQAAIVLALRPDGRGLTAVGDDAQSIYGFRGADAANILEFPRRFDPPARVLLLERNYRSTQPLLDAANAVLAGAGARHAKTLWTDRSGGARPRLVAVDDEAAQARCVADSVLARREEGLPLRRQAVLFRSAQHSATLELELLGRNIPFVKYGGLRFFESAHVKDLLALLRWAENPRARLAAFRVLRLLPGLGPVHANRLLDALDAAPDPHAALAAWRPPAAAASALAELGALVVALHAAADWPRDAGRALAWYLPQLERLYDDARARRAELELLVRLAALQPSRSAFLTELALDPPAASSDDAADPKLDDDTLVLSTIHSAKGREWSAVYLLNVVDGCIPSDMATASPAQIDEERRLLHVAMTRARDHLELYAPLRFHVTQQRAYGDRHVQASPSRFLTPAVTALFDFDAGDAPQPPPPRSLAESNGFPARVDP